MKEHPLLNLFRSLRIIGPLCLAGFLFALLILSAAPIEATADPTDPADGLAVMVQNRLTETPPGPPPMLTPPPTPTSEPGPDPNREKIRMNSEPAWLSTTRDFSTSVAWGDVDGDNDLDLAVGNGIIYDHDCRCIIGGQNKIYLNDDGTLEEEASWVSDESDDTSSIAWADVDQDGDLDLAVGNRQIRELSSQCPYTGAQNKVYLNQGGTLETTASWVSTEADFTTSVAWGDVNGDGYFDLAVGNGTPDQELPESCEITLTNRVYLNTGTGLEATASWVSTEQDETNSVAWGDLDLDGDLDLAVGNSGINRLYRNNSGSLSLISTGAPTEAHDTTQIIWVNLDFDNDMDLVTTNLDTVGQFYTNESGTLTAAQDLGEESENTLSIAFGDADNDGDLDAATGHNLQTAVYHNKNSTPLIIWALANRNQNNSVAWADIDSDGDLDLAIGSGTRSSGQQNTLYDNRTIPLNSEASSIEADYTTSIAWADVDLDKDLDLAVGNIREGETGDARNKIYLNDRGRLSESSAWQSDDQEETYDIAWADVDGDGDLDLMAGNGSDYDGECDCYRGGKNNLYLNENGTLQNVPVWRSAEVAHTQSIAWADVDGDGDLDLAVGNAPLLDFECECLIGGENHLYLNQNGMLLPSASWVSDEADSTNSIAWADIDADGDLDLAVGNDGNNRLYLNHRGTLTLDWSSTDSDITRSVAWGDVDSDGDPDLMVGNYLTPNKLYLNNEGELSLSWSDQSSLSTTSVAWGDADYDGDLDLVVGNLDEGVALYFNYQGSLYASQDDTLELFSTADTEDVAWADMDSDADLDIALGINGKNQLYSNQLTSHRLHGSDTPSIAIQPELAPANFYAMPQIHSGQVIPIPYRLTEADQIDSVTGYFSLDGGGNWQPAAGEAMSDPNRPDAYQYQWDISASNFFGQSDNVVFRLEATLKQNSSVNNVPGPFILSTMTSISYPFRVRGNQIQVFSGTVPIENALVYRLPAAQSQSSEAQLLTTNSGQAFTTDHNGYLAGRATLESGDRLLAMYPVSETDSYTLYYLSASPTETGLDFNTIEEGGVQKLTVSSDNPLLVFDLDLSLEWDARNDTVFYSQLQTALKQASTTLYDVSNGQVTIGQVNIYQAKENWTSSNIVVYGSNAIRPSANIGGIVLTSTHDIGVTGVISDAYVPGQIRMGPNWDPFGENSADLSEEWRQALAHELSHYLLFMPDNYIGISDKGNLVGLDCQGSFMTNTYDDDYSEFLTRANWRNDCLQTIAARTTGRTDWETINAFYPMINHSSENEGPSVLPLNVTQMNLMPIGTSTATEESETLDAKNYDIRNAESGALQALAGAKGYLFKTQNNSDLTDDVVMPLGTTAANGDRIKVRGADAGDRLCVLGADNQWIGCQTLTEHTSSIRISEISNWPPTIDVTPITSRTLMVEATLPAAVEKLNVQVLPAHGSLLTPTITSSVWGEMTPVDTSNRITFTKMITMDYGAFEGLVRVWVPSDTNNTDVQEAVSQFYLNSDVWGGNARVVGGGNARVVGGGNARVVGGNTRGWGAPMSSAEGQLTVFNVENPYGDTGISAFQTLHNVPNLPTWFTVVGHGYRVSLDEAFTDSIKRTLSFDYLQSDVPDGLEHTLNIYYSPDEGQSWQRMSTEVDQDDNRATMLMPNEGGGGLYALISTIEVPLRFSGWNLFAYPVQTTRAITDALQSIDGYYSTLYGYDGNNSANPWLVYDTSADSWVNTLQGLQYGQGYWIYVTEPITLSLPIDRTSSTSRRANRLISPPATYYGVVNDNNQQAQAAMPVTAWINGTQCGAGETTLVDGTLMYSISVWGAGQKAGCGTVGDTITFKLGSQSMSSSAHWDNSQVWSTTHSSDPMLIYMPIIMR